MHFSEILGSMARDGETWHADVPDSWLQGRRSRSMIWGPRGEPVALSRQSMVIFG